MQALTETWRDLEHCEKVHDLAALDRNRERARLHLTTAIDRACAASPVSLAGDVVSDLMRRTSAHPRVGA